VHERDGLPHVELRVAEWSPHALGLEQQQKLRDKLVELLAQLVAYAFVVDDAEQTLVPLIRDERGMERAINFTGSFVNHRERPRRQARRTRSAAG